MIREVATKKLTDRGGQALHHIRHMYQIITWGTLTMYYYLVNETLGRYTTNDCVSPIH